MLFLWLANLIKAKYCYHILQYLYANFCFYVTLVFTLTCHPTHNFKSYCKFSRKILFFEVIMERHFLIYDTQLLAVFVRWEFLYMKENTVSHFSYLISWLDQQTIIAHINFIIICVITHFVYNLLNLIS